MKWKDILQCFIFWSYAMFSFNTQKDLNGAWSHKSIWIITTQEGFKEDTHKHDYEHKEY